MGPCRNGPALTIGVIATGTAFASTPSATPAPPSVGGSQTAGPQNDGVDTPGAAEAPDTGGAAEAPDAGAQQ